MLMSAYKVKKVRESSNFQQEYCVEVNSCVMALEIKGSLKEISIIKTRI